MLQNCDINVEDIDRAEQIYGAPPPILQGKMVRPKQISKKVSFAPLPLEVEHQHKDIVLSIDILFVKKIPFLLCHGSPINHLFVYRLRNRKKVCIAKKLETVKAKYQSRGFKVNVFYGDNEFDHEIVRDVFPGAIFDICSADEHVPVVERAIRTVKERTRCLCNSVPYKKYTKLMTVHAVITAVRWINQFPSKGGISDIASPAKILEGISEPDMNVKRVSFGTYALVYNGTNNNMEERSVPGIALSQSNLTGGNFFMSLDTGKRIHSNSWKEVPTDKKSLH